MNVFEEMGITHYGMLLSEKDSITYASALSPELRKQLDPARVHRVQDYTGASREERSERIRQIVKIAKDNGYDAVFAGYGFMAEDEALVSALEEAGLNFIGPCSRTVKSAGSKDLAKRTALAVNVSVTPGVDNATILTLLERHPDRDAILTLAQTHDLDVERNLLEAAESLEEIAELVLEASYEAGIDLFTIDDLAATLSGQIERLFGEHPKNRIRLKAIGGGGGKGQRILSAPSQFKGSDEEKLARAVAQTEPLLREVLSEVKAGGVGDNKNVLAELNVETVRHVEIQVVGNGDWCMTLGGRDCSVQMNEQKLLEISMTQEELEEASQAALASGHDAASKALDTDRRILAAMEDEASRFGAAVGLDSVSTFECIVDNGQHYFMEMNTRIQVEHRVSELCYALRFTNPDNASESFVVNSIVELMVLLAVHGPRLPRPERERREGAAVEARLNASDDALKPHAGGVITYWSDPIEGEIRDDQGICLRNPDTDMFMKYHLAGAYDSNIALLLTTGPERPTAFARMAEVFRQMQLRGESLATNARFHYGLVNWFIGNGVDARPATNFAMPYLAAVGKLKQAADEVDIVRAYAQIEQKHVGRSDDKAWRGAVSEILTRKTSLLARALNVMLAEPHFLAGWLAVNRQHFTIDEGGVTWRTNPMVVLAGLYHYLNMDARDGAPALYAIWDHDQLLLEEGLDFYRELEAKTGESDWLALDRLVRSGGIKSDQASEIERAHEGFQLGLEILSVLPWIGHRSGFFDLRVMPDLSIEIPADLFDADVRAAGLRALSPPPVAAADEILAPTGGMFYAREAPDREAFVSAGDHFEAGDALCIIEVMKMFNKVYAPFAGTVTDVLLDTDATIVKKGDVLFKVKPDDDSIVDGDGGGDERLETGTRAFLSFIGVGTPG
ncbi:MAG: hypothetical protein KDI19_08145 [Pseudomonadales bacterium]|nr:hypothetical protein [Pseudomonadales bacterium]